MASKRPLLSSAFTEGVMVRRGRASTLEGGVLSATKRILLKKITAVEITNKQEQLLALVYKSNNRIVIEFNKRSFNYLRKKK